VKSYAVMLRKSDIQLKAMADAEMVRLINDGEIYKIYDKWFTAASGPGAQSLKLPMSYFCAILFVIRATRSGSERI